MPGPHDPYRTLGVVPGASLNEIKSAYRRLAKQYHPDAAGERALPRFLSIQAAYEALVDGEGRLRPPTLGRSGRWSAPRQQEAWRADPARARASRDAWRARRAGAEEATESREATGPTGTTGTTGSARRAGTPPGGSTAGGRGDGESREGEPRDGEPRDHSRRETQGHRRPRRATPGSTTYDEAAEVGRDPEWDGGAWYGPTSGTYWTINPREYADPRKHGPEYQARARRAAGAGMGEAGLGTSEDGAGPETGAGPDPDGWRWRASEGSAAGPGPSTTGAGAEWGTRDWEYSNPRWTEAPAGGRAGAGGSARRRPPTPDDVTFPDLEALVQRIGPRHLLALARRPDRRWRLALAIAGWPLIGFAVGSLVAELTGCAALSPACGEAATLLPLLVQPLVVAALFAAAPVAAVAAFAAIVAVAAGLPVAAVLAVGSGPQGRAGAPVVGLVMVVAYLVGLAWGAHAVWRAPAEPGNPDAQAPPDAGHVPPAA